MLKIEKKIILDEYIGKDWRHEWRRSRRRCYSAVYHAIIGPTFSASISWSGRAAKGKERKIALQKYGKIVRIIGLICNKADYQYTAEMCNRDLKYKIIKYCQSRYGECESDIK